MRIYTRTGDAGETSLFGGRRVPKDDPRVAAFGEVDELNALLGLVLTEGPPAELGELLLELQRDLFTLGADLATPFEAGGRVGDRAVPRLAPADAERLEAAIDRLEAELPPLTQFILPGGSRAGAALHLARAVCRRAERAVVALARAEGVNEAALVYLNRLADLLFVLARAVNRRAGAAEQVWTADRAG